VKNQADVKLLFYTRYNERMKKSVTCFIWLVPALIMITACSPATILNSVTPSSSFTLEKDIRFGDHPRFKLDVYQATEETEDSPIIFFSHGGGWRSGDKNLYKFIADSFTSEGLTTVIPNYRLHPGITFPDPVSDTAKAIAWTVGRFPNKPIVLVGHSAGGYNVIMNGVKSSYLAAEGIELCKHIAGVIGLAAPTGVYPAKKEPTITIFPDRLSKLDAPVNLLNEPTPPFLLLHGEEDSTVHPKNAEVFANKMIERGGSAQHIAYPKLNHVDLVRLLSRYFDDGSSLKSDIVEFIAQHSAYKTNYCDSTSQVKNNES
jgi:acetyl esterase/lipase